jgi:prepilin-type N-terminal cleavage/methylation domain-containing protein
MRLRHPNRRQAAGPSLQNNAGFTLLELLIGMAIFAIGTLAIAGLQTYSVNANALSTRQLEIEGFVNRLVESYQDIKWIDANGDGIPDNVDSDGDGNPNVLQVQDVDGDGNGGIDDTGAAADYFTGGGVMRPGDNYELSINIAPNVVVPNSLTINIIAQWDQLGRTRTYSVLFLKARDV